MNQVQRRYAADDGARIKQTGARMIKRPNPVYMIQVTASCEVETNEGVLTAKPGDFVAYDPISGHVWPVAASYVAQHYDHVPAEGAT